MAGRLDLRVAGLYEITDYLSYIERSILFWEAKSPAK